MVQLSTKITIGGKRVELTVPKGSKAERLANSIFCPLGPAPTRGWFLMNHRELMSLVEGSAGTSSTTVTWEQTGWKPKTLSFSGMYLISTSRVMTGGPADTNALHLVELADARYLLRQISETGAIIQNIRSYANTADYLTGTSGATWTSLVTTLWNQCGLLGAFPGLPYTPDGVPENTWLIGMSAWRALNAVLNQLDCAVAHNPLANQYTIVQLGGEQTIPGHSEELKWDAEPNTFNHDVAANLRIYYRYHRKSYGQERDTELVNNWAYNGAGDVQDVATGVTGANGRVALWDDLPWILDETGAHSNAAAISARTAARKTRYVTRHTVESEQKCFIGLINDILPGGKVRAVLWRAYDDIAENPALGGTCTEYIAGSDIYYSIKGTSDGYTWFDKELGAPEQESYIPPDYARASFPTYPRLPNIVQINNSGASPGDIVSANADGVHKGRVKRWVAGSMSTMDDCWIMFVDEFDTNEGDVDGVQHDYYGPARLCGVMTSDGQQLPLYLVRKGGTGDAQSGPLVQFRLYANLPTGGNALAKILTFNGAVYTESVELIRVFDFWSIAGSRPMWQAAATMVGWARKRAVNRLAFQQATDPDEYDIVYMEVFARMADFLVTGEPQGEPSGWDATNTGSWDGVDPGNDILVFDRLLATGGQRFSDVIAGCAGTASRSEYAFPNGPAQPYYNIISSQRVALTATAKAKYDFNSNQKPTINEETWLVDTQGDFVVNPGPPEQVNIRNTLKKSGKQNKLLFFIRINMTPPFVWLLLAVEGENELEVHLGKTTAAHGIDVTRSVNRYVGGTEVPEGTVDQVRNKFGAVATDKFCAYIKIDGTYYMIAARCP